MTRHPLFIATALALGTILVPAARADLSITLDTANANLATQGSGPYATYTISSACGADNVNCTANSFTVNVTLLNGFVLGDGSILDLNLSSGVGTFNLASWTATCVNGSSNTQCPISQGSVQPPGSVDGFGPFNFNLNDGAGFSDYFTALSVTFTTQNAVSLNDLLTPNNKGAEAAGHLALASDTACTGFAADSGSSSGTVDASCIHTPEPTSLLLLGTSLVFVSKFLKARLA